MKGKLFWQQVCVVLRRQIPPEEYSIWLEPLVVEDMDRDETGKKTNLFLYSENAYASQWVKKHYGEHIERAVDDVCKNSDRSKPKIFFANHKGRTPTRRNAHMARRQLGNKKNSFCKNVRLDEELTFDSFIEGDSNRMAKLMAREMVAKKAVGNLFVLCGPSGVGKTHLLHAIVNQLLKKKDQRTLFVNAENFVMDMREHIVGGRMSDFKKEYRSADMLLIDDIHFFAGKKKTLEEFSHMVKSISEQGKRMVFSCNNLPQHLDGFPVTVQTRLAQGLVTMIDRPGAAMRSAILRAKARKEGFSLKADCADYIAEQIVRSVRDLEGALRIVLFYAKAQRRAVDIPLIKEALKNIARSPVAPITLEDVQREVAAYYQLPLVQLTGTGRSRSALMPRQMAIYLARQLTKRSLSEIGHAFGGRTHTTVIHSCNTFESIIKRDSHIKYIFLSIRRKLVDQQEEKH